MKQQSLTKQLVFTGLFSALAFVVMWFEFPLVALFPAFLKFDFSDTIALIGGILLGPVAAILIELVKNMLNFLLHSTSGGIGELANFIVGISLIVPPIMMYKKTKSQVGLAIGMVVGIITMVVVACAMNYFVMLPLYMGEGWTGLDQQTKLATIWSVYVPFNLFKGVLMSVVGFAIHQGMKGIYPLMLSKKAS